MKIESAVIFRRVARIACRVLFAGLLPGSAAMAQLPISFTPGNPPPVLSGSVIPFNHGATGIWGQIYEIAIAPNGNVLFLDSANSDIYQLAPNASTPTLVAGPGTGTSGTNTCAALEASGTYWNAGIAFDSANNLYVGNRYSGVAQFCRIPYNAATNAWNFNANDEWGPISYTIKGSSVALYPQYIFIPPCSGSCATNTVYFSTSGATDVGIYEATVTVATGAIGTVTQVITGLEDFAANVTVDHAGNIFFVENIYPTPVGQRVVGIREIPAGTTGIVGSGNGAAETAQSLLVGGSSAFTGINGLFFDAQGNLYFSTESNPSYGGYVSGVFMIPNEGTPTAPNLVWNDTIMIAPVYAGQQPLVDPRGFIWIPTGGSSNWAAPGTTAPTCDSTSVQTVDATCLDSTVLIWKPGMANLGASSVVGGAPTVKATAYSVPASGGTLTLTANNSFSEDQIVTFTAGANDPLSALNGLSFYVLGSPLSSTQFAVSIPTSATSPGYVPGGASGSTSATAKLGAYSTVYYTFNQATTPGAGSFVPSNKSVTVIPNPTPNTGNLPANDTTPPPPCTAGTAYPAFSANEQSTSTFSWCYLFVALTTPEAGPAGSDLQILNSSGNIITGSNAYLSGTGQGAAISSLATPIATAVASGLSQPQQVAADAQGDMFVADASLKAVEYYPAGTTSATSGTALGKNLTAPSGVAIDLAGDLYIGDSGNIYEIPYINGTLQTSQQTKIASGLGSVLNLAVDGMGDVFVADKTNKQVVEIANPQSQLLRQGLPALQTLGSSANFTGPSAIATDNSGNVWVADGSNLWEILMPFGAASEITSKLSAPVTGLAIDPSGSVFVAESSGILWIPYQVTSTSSGLSVNAAVEVASGLGTNNSVLPISVALDGSENVYADFGSGASAGLSQLSISGTVNFNNSYAEINPAVPYEADTLLFNVGNSPLTLAAFSNDTITQTNAGEYSVIAATLNTPACGPSTNTSPGGSCYLGFSLLDSLTPPAGVGQTNASATVASNATNAGSGLNLALSANIVQDFRPSSSIVVTFAPATGTGCAGSTYPGCQTATVKVTSTSGTPQGTVIIKVPGSGLSQQSQTATLNSSGVATFSFTKLSGGSYNVLATYGGEGTAGATLNSCASSTPACFAGSAYTTTFTIARATPSFTVGPPGTEGCLSWSQSNCTPNSSYVTYYLNNYFVAATTNIWFTASVTSTVGTPTGSVSFLVNGQPVDSTQPQNSLSATGIANFTLDNLPLGTYTITAQYNGDQNFASQTDPLPTFYVINPSVQVTATPSTVSTAAGTPVTATLNLMPLVGFQNNVSLQCVTSTLPKYSECTFAYPNTSTTTSSSGQIPVGFNGATPSTIVVTISTNVPVNSGAIERKQSWVLAGIFGLGLLGVVAGRKRLNRYLTMICLAVMLSGVFMAVTSCTNAGYSTPPPAPKVSTPSGTTNVQIITFNPSTLQQNSITTPLFTLPVTVQ